MRDEEKVRVYTVEDGRIPDSIAVLAGIMSGLARNRHHPPTSTSQAPVVSGVVGQGSVCHED